MSSASHAADVLIEAEAFADRGGWVLDPQFIEQMGSPYLLAHGLGKPVANARTEVEFPETGTYHVWVRAKDWVPSHHPGRFKVIVGGMELAETFGANGQDWSWQKAGRIDVESKRIAVELKDVTGFDGRCDAVFFSTDSANTPPPTPDRRMRAWRRRLLEIPETPPTVREFDLVVVGGGVAGCCAAVTASRLGLQVALVQERPVPGGNASTEIRIWALGMSRPRVDEIIRGMYRPRPFADEKNLHTFFNMRAFAVQKAEDRIQAVDACDVSTGRETRFVAPVFVDCTGDGWIGFWADATCRHGREGYREFNESRAPNEPDRRTHGNTVCFATALADEPVTFPEVPWATAVSRGYDRIQADPPHLWEYGQGLDTLEEAERIRDHLFRAIYGTFATCKAKDPEAANLELAWVGHIAARGESRRLVGDYILNENDIVAGRVFPDAVATSIKNWFCLHYIQPKCEFRGGARRPAWETAGRGRVTPSAIPEEPLPACADSLPVGKCATVPFRCLYSRNVENLMMAGRCLSASHVALMNVKIQKTTGQMGVAVGAAAWLCRKYDTTPRGVYQRHLAELQDVVFERGQHQNALRP